MALSARHVRAGLRERNPGRVSTALVAVCALAALTACSSSDPADEKASGSTAPTVSAEAPAPSPTPTRSVSPEEAAQDEVVALYRAYWQEKTRLYADTGAETGVLKEFAVGEALVNAEKDIKQMRQDNQILTGTVSVGSPAASKTDLNREIPKVFLTSCLDITKWKPVRADTGKPVSLPATRLTKFVVKTTVEKWSEGWRVIRDRPQGEKC